MPIQLPHLDYSFDALEPHISGATLKTHHDKHHKAYVDKTNELIAGSPLSGASLEEVVRHAAQRRAHESAMTRLFNQAAQAWNHEFYWRSLRPAGGAKPTGALGDAIRGTFGSQAQFEATLKTSATDQFASGWAWLVLDGRSLRIVSTHNADTPIVHGQRPLLTIDVWEHAYYLDYQNKRPEYLQAVIGHLLNWDFATRNFEAR